MINQSNQFRSLVQSLQFRQHQKPQGERWRRTIRAQEQIELLFSRDMFMLTATRCICIVTSHHTFSLSTLRNIPCVFCTLMMLIAHAWSSHSGLLQVQSPLHLQYPDETRSKKAVRAALKASKISRSALVKLCQNSGQKSINQYFLTQAVNILKEITIRQQVALLNRDISLAGRLQTRRLTV